MAGSKGKSGRKSKPTLLKIVTGNPGHRALNESEPEPAAGELTAPDWLDAIAKQKWLEVLQHCPWITPADSDMLSLYCDAFSRYRMAQELAKQGVLTKTPEGRAVKSPAWTALNEAFQQMRSAGSELGLSPSARSGIGGGGERKKDDLAEKYFS